MQSVLVSGKVTQFPNNFLKIIYALQIYLLISITLLWYLQNFLNYAEIAILLVKSVKDILAAKNLQFQRRI